VDLEEIRGYMARVEEFKEKLLVLVHMTGGQPRRGPEIQSVRHSNTVQGGYRNLFIEDGTVAASYVITIWWTLSVADIHRTFPVGWCCGGAAR